MVLNKHREGISIKNLLYDSFFKNSSKIAKFEKYKANKNNHFSYSAHKPKYDIV